ncbi:hypothetical protein QVD17_28356 [Tagetes erecta]|uniref:Uncharacterized protein n=1 Tax=Tagetes erecta TaxID=13708 RepID=A0AAD8NS19_TARER|nr:hypothetical protein QVD17_28356 [Tagetes erecta]
MLEIKSISGLTDEVWKGVLKYLGAVEHIRILSCNEIRYLWESEAHVNKVLENLKILHVSKCQSLVSLGEEGVEDTFGNNFLSSLSILDVHDCLSMERCCCPNNIENLYITGCKSVTRVSFPTTTKADVKKLQTLVLYDGNYLMENINSRSLSMLERVSISGWTNLISINQLNINFIHLTNLTIYDCPSIESFPDLQLSNLTHLSISKCPSMEYTFPCGRWPLKLVGLRIGGLNKPILEWGAQNFPTSLVDLMLFGEGNVSNFSKLRNLLPSSLTTLQIIEFDKLESLSEGLEHLMSLEHLAIRHCPKVMHLPKSLLPSLMSLTITKCKNLKKRCDGRGSHYWRDVSHIPRIDIRDK